MLLITCLLAGTAHFGELRRSIGGISKKVLTESLRKLERDGMIRRSTTALRVGQSNTP
jgi:DNA-binding HxlR family transcriptional regulator